VSDDDDVRRGFLRSSLLLDEARADLVALAKGIDAVVGLLVDKGLVAREEIEDALAKAAPAAVEPLLAEGRRGRVQLDDGGDKYTAPNAEVDCAARIPHCKAACCALQVPLGAGDLEEGHLRWQLDRPYLLRKADDGRCEHQDRKTGFCGDYDHRPRHCRAYSCATDTRIWRDFDKMIPNEKGLRALLEQRLVEPIVPIRKTPPRR
jgi:Fe-S-cluster containining protein